MKKRLAALLICFSLAVCGTPADVFASSGSGLECNAEGISSPLETFSPENESTPADVLAGSEAGQPVEGTGPAIEESGAANVSTSGNDDMTEAGAKGAGSIAGGAEDGGSGTGIEDGSPEGSDDAVTGKDSSEAGGPEGTGGGIVIAEGGSESIESGSGTGEGGSEGGESGSEGGESGSEGGESVIEMGENGSEGGESGSGTGEGGSEGGESVIEMGENGSEGGESGSESGEGGSGTGTEDDDDEEGLISIEDGEILGIADHYLYTGKYIQPAVTVTLNGETLTKGEDYLLLYGYNREVGNGVVMVIGINDYCGVLTQEFGIYPVLSLTATSRTTGLKLSWNSYDDRETYTVYRKNSEGVFEEIKTTSACSFLDTNVVSGGSYVYKVAGKKCGSRNFVGQYLATPAISRLEGTRQGIKIAWRAVEGATSYRVYAVRGGKYVKLGDTAGTDFTDTGAKNGVECTYTVRAMSPVKSDYDRAGTSFTCFAPPTVTKAGNSADGCLLKWTAVEGTAKYRIYRKVAGGKWKRIADTTGLKYTDTTAEAGSTYQYRVRCLGGNGWWLTGNSDSVKVTRILRPVLKKAVLKGGNVKITWRAAAGATKYRVYRKTVGGSFAKIGDTADLFFVDATARKGETYVYTVRAIKPTTSLYDKTGLTITA